MSTRIHGILGEFGNPGGLLKAAEDVREAGYKNFDVHSPFPIHGMDDAMGLPRTKLGLVIGIAALLGAIAGFTLQWWSSTIAYPMVIAGKPFFSWQAFIVVTFGLMVLGGAFSALFGMLGANKLPQLFHPLFYSENFKRFSDDGFFVSIDSKDPGFDETKTAAFLDKIGAINVEVIAGE